MAYSEITYSAAGGVKDFTVTFDYLDASHVYVSVDNVVTTEPGSNYTAEMIGSTTMRVSTVVDGDPPPAGAKVRLFRKTPIDQPAVVFGGGASLSSENLNKNSEYLTFALQEATDNNEEFTKLYLGSFESAPISDNEGDTLQQGAVYYDSIASALFYWTGSAWIIGESTIAAEVFKDGAEAARDIAVAAEAASLAHKDEAAVSASTAVTKAGEASTSADEAAESAAVIDPDNFIKVDDKATQVEAEAGTDNSVYMTPLRTAEAIEELSPAPSELTEAQATDDTSAVFGTVSGERLNQETKASLNVSGAAPMFACRAWVNFNGTGTVAIRASGNVSSITDNGDGDYTVNFTNALPDANYAIAAGARRTDDYDVPLACGEGNASSAIRTTTQIRVATGGKRDADHINVIIVA